MTKKEMRREMDALILLRAQIRQMEADFQDRFIQLRAEMHNRPPKMRGKRTSASVTPDIVQKVHRLHEMFPDMNQNDLGKIVGIPGPRVSEIISGKRT